MVGRGVSVCVSVCDCTRASAMYKCSNSGMWRKLVIQQLQFMLDEFHTAMFLFSILVSFCFLQIAYITYCTEVIGSYCVNSTYSSQNMKTYEPQVANTYGWREPHLQYTALTLYFCGSVFVVWTLLTISVFHLRETEKESASFQLFRLLLMYHEPDMCNFLDTRKIFPDSYASSWVRTQFCV